MDIRALLFALALTCSLQVCFAQKEPIMPYGSFSSTEIPVPWRSELYKKKWVSVDSFTYIDNVGKRWVAPAKTITDGASIPGIATWIVGEPTDYMRPALIHDAYCGIDNEKHVPYATEMWDDIHRMFYMACLADGKSCLTALTVYAAIRMAGPREVQKGNDRRLKIDTKKKAKTIEKHLVTILRKADRDSTSRVLLVSFLDTTDLYTTARSAVIWGKIVSRVEQRANDINTWEYIVHHAPMLKVRSAPTKLKQRRFLTIKDTLTKVSTAPSCPIPQNSPQTFRSLNSTLDNCRVKLFIDIWYYRRKELSFIQRLLS